MELSPSMLGLDLEAHLPHSLQMEIERDRGVFVDKVCAWILP